MDLYYLIDAVITQIFNTDAELVIPTEIPINEANAAIETIPLIAAGVNTERKN